MGPPATGTAKREAPPPQGPPFSRAPQDCRLVVHLDPHLLPGPPPYTEKPVRGGAAAVPPPFLQETPPKPGNPQAGVARPTINKGKGAGPP